MYLFSKWLRLKMCVFNVETVVVSRLQSRRNKHPWFDDVMVKGRAC